MSKHMTLTERTLIERYLVLEYPLAFIARKLSRSQSTISREIKKHRCYSGRFSKAKLDCIYRFSCFRRNLCPSESKYSCYQYCKFCTEYSCANICKHYISDKCTRLEKAPYVCTRCPEEKSCKRIHAYYSAHRAEQKYLSTLKNSRKGPQASPQELADIDTLIGPLLRKGQSLNHILANHSSEIRFSERTIYNYIDRNTLSVKNIDLPKKVRYRLRHTEKILDKFKYRYRKGRTIEDYKAFIENNPDTPVVEMDTVKGCRKSGQVLLTFIFRENNFMLVFLMEDGTQNSVIEVFDYLNRRLGTDLFKQLFPVILTDNGVEFKCPHSLEYDDEGEQRTHIFYCDPQASWQKPHVEKNHVLIRRILPKGTSFKFLTSEDVRLITCHINSVAREIFDNCTPFDLMTANKYKKLLEALALSAIPPDEVCLNPSLLKHKM